ncbi:copper homeostasis protein CutC [Pseudactinotalea sp. HY158]|nr:copper homeostasis protein CutC [Pseudactinotalea sp. HY158]
MTRMNTAIELAVQDVAGTLVAAEVGADRVELGSALGVGGLTPSRGVIEAAVAAGAPHGVEVHVLIRPRAGDFVFTPAETAVMIADVRHAVAAGAAGVVIGALTPTGEVDLPAVDALVAAADGAEVTFHRAIDVSGNLFEVADTLLGHGITRVLTSGGALLAADGTAVLSELVDRLAGRMQVMAGSGINPGNVAAVAATGVDAVHFSAKEIVAGDALALGSADDGGYERTDPLLARRVVDALAADLALSR